MSHIINKITNTKELHAQFIDAKPFPHVVIDNFFTPEAFAAISQEFPNCNDQIWFEYSNPVEKKLACDDMRKFPLPIATAIHFLNSETFLKDLEAISGMASLQSDPYLHGGGIHSTKCGGKLDMHLDYSIHPKLKLERRLNLIVYVSPEWNGEWGGNLELWNENMTECVKKVGIKPNRAVLFETGDISYHGHPDPTNSPEEVTRNSIALYYLTEPRANCPSRPRALFVARPQDDKSPELEEFRKKRSEVLGVYKDEKK